MKQLNTMHHNYTIISVLPKTGNTAGSKKLIDPETNFLLRRAAKVAESESSDNTATLFLLHNGNYAIHTRYKNDYRSDSLERASFDQITSFGFKLILLQ